MCSGLDGLTGWKFLFGRWTKKYTFGVDILLPSYTFFFFLFLSLCLSLSLFYGNSGLSSWYSTLDGWSLGSPDSESLLSPYRTPCRLRPQSPLRLCLPSDLPFPVLVWVEEFRSFHDSSTQDDPSTVSEPPLRTGGTWSRPLESGTSGTYGAVGDRRSRGHPNRLFLYSSGRETNLGKPSRTMKNGGGKGWSTVELHNSRR